MVSQGRRTACARARAPCEVRYPCVSTTHPPHTPPPSCSPEEEVEAKEEDALVHRKHAVV